jgi:predicted MFS family arabinose efflux permease
MYDFTRPKGPLHGSEKSGEKKLTLVVGEQPAGEPTSAQHKSEYRWVVLLVATIAQASASFVMQGLGVLAGFLQQEFNLTTAEVGLLITVSGAAPVVALPIIGDLLDRKSERLIIGIGAGLVALGLVVASLASTFTSILVCLFVVGVGYSATQPGGSKSVSVWFRRSRLGLAMGIRQAGLPLGGAAAAVVLPYLVNYWNWKVAFIAGAVVALSGGLAFAALYRSPADASGRNSQKQSAITLSHLIAMLRQPWMRNIVLSGAALVASQYAILVFFMLFLRDVQGIPLTVSAWFMFVAQLSGVSGRIALAAWSDRPEVCRFRLVRTSMLAVGSGLLLLLLIPSQTPTVVLAAIAAWLGFFGLGWYGPWVAHITEAAPSESVGRALGAAMAINQVAIIAAPPLLGLLRDFTGSYAWLWSSAIALLIIASWSTRRRE